LKLLLVVALAVLLATAQTSPHWRETDTETIWTGRYSNCDYGYYVTLPAGVVGHGDKSPAPNHGFVLNPAAPERTETFTTVDSNRYIGVNNYYDVADHAHSIRATLNYYAGLGEIEKSANFTVLGQEDFRLAGLNAKRIQLRRVEGSQTLREDRIVAYRPPGHDSGVVYQFTLVTPENSYGEDNSLFDEIVRGFHLTKLPIGECSND